MNQYKYDVAISYASEQESFVSNVVCILESEGISIFFAPKSKREFIGQNMVEKFYKIYRYECKFVAAFVSYEYLKKNYCMQEANTALLREPLHGFSRLIPIYLNGAILEELNSNINYITSDQKNYVSVANDILNILKLAKSKEQRQTEQNCNAKTKKDTSSANKKIIIYGDVNGDISQS